MNRDRVSHWRRAYLERHTTQDRLAHNDSDPSTRHRVDPFRPFPLCNVIGPDAQTPHTWIGCRRAGFEG